MTFEKYNDTDIELWTKMYLEDKLSAIQIGKKLGVDVNTVRRRLSKKGIKMRKRNEVGTEFYKKYNDADVELWKKMYFKNKISIPEIGRRLEVSHSTINKRKMRYNKKGTFFFGIASGLVIFIFGVLFLPFLLDDVTTFRDAMDCSSSDISGGNMLSCLLGDAAIPYFILFFISLALGFIVGSTK